MPEATAQKEFSCPSCGGEMIQKSKAQLIVVGLCMWASAAIAFATHTHANSA
jgi:ribosomal protein L37AE/L43A